MTKTLGILIGIFLVLQVLDVLTTAIGLANGLTEGNPLYYAIGPQLFYVGKAIMVIHVIIAIRYLPNYSYLPQVKLGVMWFIVIASALVVAWNLYGMVELGR